MCGVFDILCHVMSHRVSNFVSAVDQGPDGHPMSHEAPDGATFERLRSAAGVEIPKTVSLVSRRPQHNDRID